MRKLRTYIVLVAFACALAYVLFPKPQPTPQPPTPQPQEPIVEPKDMELSKKSFSDLSNWSNDNMSEASHAFTGSCQQVLKEKNEYLSNSLAQIPTLKYQQACTKFLESNITTDQEFRDFIEANFDPYLVSSHNNEFGKFTSYYESALNASYTKTNKYKYPVYGKPNDLISFNPKDFDETAASKRYVGRVEKQKLVPYYTREEIDKQGINAPVILWADSHIDIYIMQIQGSAVATLPDGQEVRIGYADTNGLPFRGVGSILLSKGLLEPGKASMGEIKKWLEKNGQLALDNMNENKRYVFHKINHLPGPVGAHGVPLTAGRSLAVDRSYIPLGSLLWLETTDPDQNKIEKLIVAQDIGGAIKGAVRGDYFWGSGKDEVLDKAGRMHSTGRYFIFIPK